MPEPGSEIPARPAAAVAGDPRPPRNRRRHRAAAGLLLLVTYLMAITFGGCADRLLLFPTTGTIDASGATRAEVPVPGRSPVEVYARRANVPPGGEPSAYLLVLDGNGGRAEYAVFWGDDAARGRAVEVWSPNYPG